MDETPEREEHAAVVPEGAAGTRADRFLASALGVARRRVMEAFEAGEVRADGKRIVKGAPVTAGQRLTARLLAPPSPPVPQPELPLVVVHEDPAFVVVEKPSGWATHPLANGERGTLANAIVARWPDAAAAGRDVRESVAAHRLDLETSGLVLAARSRDAWEAFRSQLAARTVLKEYLALAAGSVYGPVEVSVPIARDPGVAGRMRVVADDRQALRLDGRDAHTVVEVERPLVGWTLVRCRISTGVMHQIRVHLAHLGSPVAGDDLYGGSRPAGLHRMFLHAARLGFDHPVTGERLTFDSPLPKELASVLASLGG